ncbi:MAG: energy transducer TonB [Candidatus Acidiferrales bacterium]
MADFTTRSNLPERTTDQPGMSIGRFQSPARRSEWKDFFSNLKYFLFERRIKVRGGAPAVFVPEGFGDSTGSNLRELFRAAPREAVNSGLLVSWNSGFGSVWQNLRDTFFPAKLPPLKTDSQPVAVKEIWSKNTQFTRVQALSMAFHVVVLVLIILPLVPGLLSPATTKASSRVEISTDISSFLPKLAPGVNRAGGGGGGGSHDLRPATGGRVPKFSMIQFTPPRAVTNPNARLAMTPTVLGPPELRLTSPNMNNWGDPLSKVLNDSNGPGSGNGIGSGKGTGVGPGDGAGAGPGDQFGAGDGPPGAGTYGYGYPVCTYCPQAQYSVEAIKAKYQGTVLLVVTITADGKATDINVVKGLGLGLDEKAIEAVRAWRFRPAVGPDRRPAAVRQTIEVTFHLY